MTAYEPGNICIYMFESEYSTIGLCILFINARCSIPRLVKYSESYIQYIHISE